MEFEDYVKSNLSNRE